MASASARDAPAACLPNPHDGRPVPPDHVRHRLGFAILDERSRQVACTTPHPVGGRPIAALEPDAKRALSIAAEILASE